MNEFLRRTQRWRLPESREPPWTALFSLERAMENRDGECDCDGSDGIDGARAIYGARGRKGRGEMDG